MSHKKLLTSILLSGVVISAFAENKAENSSVANDVERIVGVQPEDMPIQVGNKNVILACDFGSRDATTNLYTGAVELSGSGDLVFAGSKEWYFRGKVSGKGSGRVVVPKGVKVHSLLNGGNYFNMWIEGEVDSDGYASLPLAETITVADGGLLHVRRCLDRWGPCGFGTIKVLRGGKVQLHNDSMGLMKTWRVDGGIVENLSADGKSMIYRMNMSDGGRIIGSPFSAGSAEYITGGYPGSHINAATGEPCRVDCSELLLCELKTKRATGVEPVQLRFNVDRDATLYVSAALKNGVMNEIESPDCYGFVKQGEGTLVLESGENCLTNGSFRLDGGTLSPAKTFGGRIGALGLKGNAVLDLSSGAKVAFDDSSKVEWGVGGKLVVKGLTKDNLRFGTSADALTAFQLSQIATEDMKSGMRAELDKDGYLVIHKGSYYYQKASFRGYIKGSKPVLVFPGKKLADARGWANLAVNSDGYFKDGTTPETGFRKWKKLRGALKSPPCKMNGQGGSNQEGIYNLTIAEDGSRVSFWVVYDMWKGRAAAKVQLTQGADGVYAQVVKTTRRSGLKPDGKGYVPNVQVSNVDWDSPELEGCDATPPAVRENSRISVDSWMEVTYLGGLVFESDRISEDDMRNSVFDGYRAELLKGVDAIDIGGGAIPGDFVILDDKAAFPLAEAEASGASVFAAVGAVCGKGRAVYLGHPGYFAQGFMCGDSEKFLENSVKWTTHGKKNPKICVLRDSFIADTLKRLGFDNVTRVNTVSEASDGDMLIMTSPRADEVDGVLEFVRQGGGLIGAPLGWGYMSVNKTANFAKDFVDNRVCVELGFLAGRSSVGRINGAYPTRCEDLPLGMIATEAIAIAEKWDDYTEEAHKQALATLTTVIDALPMTSRADLRARFESVPDEPELERLFILNRKAMWQANPENPIAADPLAEKYPGLVKPGTPKIEKSLSVNLAVPRWHSTGVFAVAGDPIKVQISDDATKLGLRVRIGTTADDVTVQEKWWRAPLVTCEVALTKRETTVYNPFGGLVYIVVPNGLTGDVEVGLSGGVMAPWFKLGRDTNEHFAKEVAETGAPYAEIEGNEFIITEETDCMKRVDDAKWVAEYWDTVLREDRELVGTMERRSPERFCSDVQLTGGLLHNGYPLMGLRDIDGRGGAIDRKSLSEGKMWGIYHEIGHNHQGANWTPSCCGEVTVNIFSCLAIDKAAKCDWRQECYLTGREKQNKLVQAWVARGKKHEEWKKNWFLELEIYLRLQEAFGWDTYKKVLLRYREPEYQRLNNVSDDEKFSAFAQVFSEVTERNIAEVFAAWSIPVSDSVREACTKYPAAPASLTEGL